MHILIVDDDTTVRRVGERLLLHLGANVETAVNGLEAVAAVKDSFSSHKKLYDCILMDFHMPEMDGLQAINKIRDNHGDEAPPIIGTHTARLHFLVLLLFARLYPLFGIQANYKTKCALTLPHG